MNLGIDKAIKDGNGNTLIYTALLAAMIANAVPTPADSIYFRRINILRQRYDKGEITAENLEWHIAMEYYLWTAAYYGLLFTAIYSFGGTYKNNARILLGLVASGLVIGAVQKNIQSDKELEELRKSKSK
jgi:hypothetical protein